MERKKEKKNHKTTKQEHTRQMTVVGRKVYHVFAEK
jgi:hypothetical protein